mgnify:CR=1 FL=1
MKNAIQMLPFPLDILQMHHIPDIQKLRKHSFLCSHEISSSQKEISSIDNLYIHYIIDTRYCQFISETHLQTSPVHSHPDCFRFRGYPQILPLFWHPHA